MEATDPFKLFVLKRISVIKSKALLLKSSFRIQNRPIQSNEQFKMLMGIKFPPGTNDKQIIVLQDNAVRSNLTQFDIMRSNTFLPVLNATESICTKTLAKTQGRISPYKFLVPCLSVRVKFTNQ